MNRCQYKKIYRRRIIRLFLFILIFICGIVLIKNSTHKDKSSEKTVKKNEVKESKLSLVMVGDGLLHSSVYKDAYQNGVYDFSTQLQYIKPIIRNYDLAFYNQESILGGSEIGLSDYPTFN